MLTREDLQELVEEARLLGIPWGNACTWELSEDDQSIALLPQTFHGPAESDLHQNDSLCDGQLRTILFSGMRWASVMRAARARGFAAEEYVENQSNRPFRARARFFRMGDEACHVQGQGPNESLIPLSQIYDHQDFFDSFVSKEILLHQKQSGFFLFSRLMEKREFAHVLARALADVVTQQHAAVPQLSGLKGKRGLWERVWLHPVMSLVTGRRNLNAFVSRELKKLMGSTGIVVVTGFTGESPFEKGRQLLDFWIRAQSAGLSVGSYFFLPGAPDIWKDLRDMWFKDQPHLFIYGVLRLGPAPQQKAFIQHSARQMSPSLVWSSTEKSGMFRTQGF